MIMYVRGIPETFLPFLTREYQELDETIKVLGVRGFCVLSLMHARHLHMLEKGGLNSWSTGFKQRRSVARG